ncbi:MAG: M15 family metallopeptidase [Cyanobacteriota bacterium]|nr:M15 family metallopeptidase [Cyanobacteriota bacterium]
MKNWKKAIAHTQSPKSANRSVDDIPEATRDVSNSPVRRDWLRISLLATGGIGLCAIAVLSSVLLTAQMPSPDDDTSVSTDPSPEPSPEASPIENVLGHLPYEVAPPSELQAIAGNASIRLRSPAVQKYDEMAAAARASGVILAPISGFRTVEEQNRLFFEIKAQRNQVASQRAEVSAPPGYSEHHTGYAIDIGDGTVPSTHLQVAFENTPAFKWLEQNAARYDFELSYPRNNPQGVSYEPWHWRFVGDIRSLEMFYRARNLPKETNP